MSLFSRLFSKSRTTVLHITSSNGFHLRPAAVFVKEAKRFSCDIEAETRGKNVNAKNLNALLSLNLDKGDHFDLVCKGKDAPEAVTALTRTFETLMQNEKEVVAPATKQHTYEGHQISAESIADGIAIAPLWHYEEKASYTQTMIGFQDAVKQSLDDLEALYIQHQNHTDSDIYLAQKALLEAVAQAFDTLESFEERIARESQALQGGKMEAKISDYHDILQRVKTKMGYRMEVSFPKDPFILFADDLLPSQVEHLPLHTKGVILRHTSPTSHSAILLRSAGLPALIVRDPLPPSDAAVILDGYSASLVVAPTHTDLSYTQERQKEEKHTKQVAFQKCSQPAVTSSGHKIAVLANVTDVASAQEAKEQGAEGIGLLRTEFLFKEEAPDFKAQCDAYGAIFALFEEVTVRTLDVGGDKALPYIDLPQESNPFLGIRGVRLFKTHSELIETQLRAIFSAAQGRTIKLMFPMVATVEEFIEAKRFAQEVAASYTLDISRVQFGMMVEVPSVLFTLKAFDEVVDFYSIGTNDLTQYLFATERTHPTLSVASLSEALWGAIEKILVETTKPVSLCGEIAAEVEAIPKLITLGIGTLSVSPGRIATTKETIRHV